MSDSPSTIQRPATPAASRPSTFAPIFFTTWLIGLGVFILVLASWGNPDGVLKLFRKLDLELPILGIVFAELGAFMTTRTGIAVFVLFGVATVLPFVRGARGVRSARCYAVATAVAGLAIMAVFFGLGLPIARLKQKLDGID